MKKVLMGVLGLLLFIPGMVCAAGTYEARIGEENYATFEEAYAAIEKGESATIVLLKDVTLDSTLILRDRNIVIDMNSFDISGTQNVLLVFNAKVEFKGTGTIKETSPNLGAVMLKGTADEEDVDSTYVIIGENVTLEGWAPVFFDNNGSGATTSNYGMRADIYGKLKAVNDTAGGLGVGVYVNGSIKNKTSYPIINIYDGAEIESTGMGLFLAGYTATTIGEVEVEAIETGIGIKSGKLTINGANVSCTGENAMPTEGNGNGMNASGAALQIESNTGYAGDMEIVINDGYFTSTNAVTVYDYIGAGTELAINKFEIKGGTFFAAPDVFSFSEEFLDTFKGFVTGGNFSGNVAQYIPAGYKSTYGSASGFKVEAATVPAGTKSISGTITNGAGITVQLKQGGLVLRSTEANAEGEYSFEDVASGAYNIVASYGEDQMLFYIEVGNENLVYDFTFAENALILEQEGNTPNVVLNDAGLDLSDHTINVGYVELDEEIGDSDELEDVEDINTLAPKTKKVYFDISIYSGANAVTELDSAIEFIIDFDFKNKENFEVYRNHGGVAGKLTKLSARPLADFEDGTFYADTTNNKLHIYTSKFSVYAVGYTAVANPKTGDNVVSVILLGSMSLVVLLGAVLYTKKQCLSR